jgi:phosphoribosyl-ATP pyrophosphohydrolase/phosphoribosyl-AMP cyclohydrolase/histidinol dehydrogenase
MSKMTFASNGSHLRNDPLDSPSSSTFCDHLVTMSLPVFLPQIDTDDLSSLQALARLGPVLIPGEKVATVKAELAVNSSYYVEATDGDLISYLDQGAHKIVVSRQQLEQLEGVTEDKLVLKIAENEVNVLADKALLASVSAIIIELDGSDSLPSKDSIKSHVPGYNKPTFFRGVPTASAVELIRQLYPASTTIVLPTSAFNTISIADAFLAPINSDRPDGLFPTVVSSYLHTSRSLGLVYSSRESIAEHQHWQGRLPITQARSLAQRRDFRCRSRGHQHQGGLRCRRFGV